MWGRGAFILILLLSLQAQANVRELATQTDCLCRVQTPPCDREKPRHYLFSRKQRNGELHHYVVHVGSGFPQIYRLQPPSRQQSKPFHDPQLWLAQVGRGADQSLVIVKLNELGQISYSQQVPGRLADVQAELANWQEARRLENLLWINGLNQNPEKRGLGDWLIRRSSWMAEGLEATDGSLSEVVRRYDDDSLFPDLSRARQAEVTYRDLFTDCNAGQSLCRKSVNGLALAQTRESMDAGTLNAWRGFFQRQAALHLAHREQTLADLCPDLPENNPSDNLPLVESPEDDIRAPVRTSN